MRGKSFTIFIFLLFSSVAIETAFALDVAQGDGILFYSAASNTTPQVRTYGNFANDFSANSGTVVGAQPAINAIKTSPTKQEAVAAYQDTSGNLRVLCYDGTSWTQDWTVAVASSGTPTTRRFDISYETNTGDVTVAYSRSAAAVNALAYRTKLGSTGCGSGNWAAAANFPTSTTTTSGTVQWVRAARDGRSSSDLSMWVWLDNAATAADLGAATWSGTAFGNLRKVETSMEHITAVGDTDNFDTQYESTSGDAMIVWGWSGGASGTSGYRYITCTGGTATCTWSATSSIPTVADDAMMIDLSSDPLSDRLAMAGIGTASADMSAGYWSGTAWTGYANVDITAEGGTAGMRNVATGWLNNNGNKKWFITYDDASGTGLSYKYAIDGAALTAPADYTSTPAINDIRGRYEIDVNPFDNSQAIQTLSDSTNGIFAYRITMDSSGNLAWSDMASAASLGTKPSHPQQGFAYTFWRFIPTTTYTLSAFGLFNNIDSTNVGTTLAATNATGTLSTTGSAFRLRPLIHVGVNQVAVSGQSFKLQYAGIGAGTCASPSGTPSSYTDVSISTLIAYFTNTTAFTDSPLTANANDPTHSSDTVVNQKYMESSPFTNSVAAIPSGQDGKWDLALFDNGAPADTTYCLKIVKSDGSDVDTYSVIPAVITSSASAPQSISFAISATSAYFGTLSSAGTRYGSSTNVNGDSIEVQAHTLDVATNATNGYSLTVQGATLTNQQDASKLISALSSNTTPSIGTEQFGLRMTASGGIGTVSVPYAASGFALTSTATTSTQVASASSGDSATTTYSVRYMVNIAPTTAAGNYTTNLVYVVTANF